MKTIQSFIACAVLAVASSTALAQFVKGNEAVKVMADGSKRVETPPTKGALLVPPCPAASDGCGGGGWKMVETKEGLVECTEVYARESTCRKSSYGAEKRWRFWIVKSGSKWMQCQYPDLASKCVDIKGLPYGASQ